MAQNYTQTTYTQAFVARRNADAILAIAPFTAAISVSPAPLSNVEKLEARLAVMRRNGLVRMHVRVAAATMTTGQRAGVLRDVLDAPRPHTGLPVTEAWADRYL
jgi:hypothetical protein